MADKPKRPTTHRQAAPKPNIKQFKVSKESELLPYLLEVLQGQSRTTIKSLLGHQMVMVDGKTVKQFNHMLRPGNRVSVGKGTEKQAKQQSALEILFEDDYLIVINKPSGLLTIATDSEKNDTAFRLVSDHVKRQNPRNRVFILHRLDRDTSGVMMFAKNPQVQAKLQQNWDEDIVNREYQAVVEGKLRNSEGVLENWLIEGKTGIVHVSKQAAGGKKAITHYKLIKSNELYSLLNLKLETGRKNQIRVQLSHMGYPVTGDKKFGAKSSPIKRLALHACELSFVHPVTGSQMVYKTPVPPKFLSIFKNR